MDFSLLDAVGIGIRAGYSSTAKVLMPLSGRLAERELTAFFCVEQEDIRSRRIRHIMCVADRLDMSVLRYGKGIAGALSVMSHR